MSRAVDMQRDDAQVMEMTQRSFALRADSVNEEQRSVEALVVTGDPVEVFDWMRYEPIEEVLVMRGGEIPDTVPLLDNHARYSLDNVFGSVRGFELKRDEDGYVARMYFDEGDDSEEGQRVQRAWRKVKGGHMREVSAGYRVHEYTDIEPGQSAMVGGKRYTAGSRVLRVSTKWTMREVSLVPIGADKRTHIRKEHGVDKLRQYLVSLGLRADATEKELWDFYRALSDQGHQERALELAMECGVESPPEFAAEAQRQETPPVQQRQETPAPEGPSPQEVAQEAVRAERERISSLRSMFGGDAPELLARAEREGWTPEQASPELLEQLRRSRNPVNQGPGIHSRSHETDATVEAMQAALMMRNGTNVEARLAGRAAAALNIPNWMRQDINDDARQQVMERGHRFSDMSLLDMLREAIRIDGNEVPRERSEVMRSAFSGSALQSMFTTNVSAALLVAFEEYPDTTMGWTTEEELPNFQIAERAIPGKMGALTRHGRGGTAEDMDTDAVTESYRLARYSGKFTIDEMDIIDDRFGSLGTDLPDDMGRSAAQLRPDLVYAILLANANLDADGNALFDNATHGNDPTGAAFSAANLEALIVAMGKQRIKTRPLNIRPRYLLVPHDLQFTARTVVSSAERREAATANGTMNPLQNQNLMVISDDRLGAAGVTDPASDTALTGSATNYFLAARPGEGGAKTIEVGFLRGSGRVPQVRSEVLSKGQWGMCWDVKHDIGAKALDYRGLARNVGA